MRDLSHQKIKDISARLTSSSIRPLIWTLWALPLIQCVSFGLATPKPLSFLATISVLLFWAFFVLPVWWLSHAYSRLLLRLFNARGLQLWGCLAMASALSFITIDALGYFYLVNQVFNGWVVNFEPPFGVSKPQLSTFFPAAFYGAIGHSAIWLTANLSSRLLLGRTIYDSEPITTDRVFTFMHQVPEDQRHGLLAIQAQEHYINVHTTTGTNLVLYRFGDALKELSDVPGKQVHRSFWVANSSVESYKRDNGQLFLTLHNDMKVPVSRSFLRDVEKPGFLPRADA